MIVLTGLRQAREQAALSQADLARAAGVRQGTISQLERGLTAARPSTTRRLAAALGVAPVVLQQAGQPAGQQEQDR